MRSVILFIPFFLAAIITSGQNPVKKGYAYSRDFIPGIQKVKAGIENPNPVKEKTTVKTEYYIFIEGEIDTAKIKCRAVWINKKKYSVLGINKVNTPVTDSMNYQDSQSAIQMVGPTDADVVRIWPGKLTGMSLKINNYLQNVLRNNEAMIEIISNEKLYYIKIKKIKKLEPFSGA